jgi:hypothetical protein
VGLKCAAYLYMLHDIVHVQLNEYLIYAKNSTGNFASTRRQL